jgi:hypothetical protein
MCQSYFWKSLLILIFLSFPGIILAQLAMEDVVYLNNGSILRGEIIEINEDEYLKVKISGGSVFFILMDEVEKIKREKAYRPKLFKQKGYVNYTGLEILSGDQGSNAMRYQMVNGYQFTPLFSAGLGIGFVNYHDPLNTIPVFADARFKLLKSNTAPFIFLKGGYNFSVNPNEEYPIEDHSGGLMLNAGIGIQFEINENVGWYFNAGYNIDKMEYEEEGFGGRSLKTSLVYKRIHFGFGLAF